MSTQVIQIGQVLTDENGHLVAGEQCIVVNLNLAGFDPSLPSTPALYSVPDTAALFAEIDKVVLTEGITIKDDQGNMVVPTINNTYLSAFHARAVYDGQIVSPLVDPLATGTYTYANYGVGPVEDNQPSFVNINGRHPLNQGDGNGVTADCSAGAFDGLVVGKCQGVKLEVKLCFMATKLPVDECEGWTGTGIVANADAIDLNATGSPLAAVSAILLANDVEGFTGNITTLEIWDPVAGAYVDLLPTASSSTIQLGNVATYALSTDTMTALATGQFRGYYRIGNDYEKVTTYFDVNF